MEARPLAFSPPGISPAAFGKDSQSSRCLGIQLAALPAEPCPGPATAHGLSGCGRLQEMASSSVAVFLCAGWRCYWVRRCSSILARGPPRSQLVLAGCAVDECGAWGGGAVAEPAGAAVTTPWRNSSVAVGQVAAGMEIETQGFQLGVCLSKISIFWVSAFPHPDTVTVTQLCLLPAGRAEPSSAAGDGAAAQPGCSPGFRLCFCCLFMHVEHHERVKAHFCRCSRENTHL